MLKKKFNYIVIVYKKPVNLLCIIIDYLTQNINIFIINKYDYPADSLTQFDYTILSILPTYSSIANPTILFNYGTSGIYKTSMPSNTIIVFTSSTTALTV
jgi:hypothetical protein